ncbi:MAG: TetR/AcrR family transcriptional regulator [Myxococcales bacterium]|nr:MAG: TetR/AcrR family transcriptional regulator [Myxococcales bacterium]
MTAPHHPKQLSRKAREHMFRIEIVLDAAQEVFMEQPFAAARIEDIAQRAELSVGTLYNLFESKQEIYKALVSRQQDRYFERINADIDSTDDPVEQLHCYVSAFFAHVVENFAAWRFHVYATAGLSSTLRNELFQEAQEAQASFLRRLTGVCRTGIDSGVFRAGLAPELMALAINSVPDACLSLAFQQNHPKVLELAPGAITAVDRIAGVA